MRTVSCAVVFAVLAGCSGLRLASAPSEEGSATVIRGQNATDPVPGIGYTIKPWLKTNRRNDHALTESPGSAAEGRPTAEGHPPDLQGLTLRDAVLHALSESDVVRTLNGDVTIQPITTIDPLIAEFEWQREATIFDPNFKAEFEGSQINEPPDSFFGPGISAQTRRDEGNFSASLDKTWPLGTTTRIAYDPSLGYLFFPQEDDDDDFFNPSYSSDLVMEIRQPLLRGAGRTVNLAPIRVAQTQFEQTIWEVEELVQAEVRSVEQAYWNLQAAHRILTAIEEVIPLAQETVRIEELRFKSERNIYADVARAKFQLESFIQQKLRAERTVRTRDFQLRQLIGLPVVDGATLIPVDAPEQGFQVYDLDRVVQVAYERRPDLIRRRLGLQESAIELAAAENSRFPELDVFAKWRSGGLKSRLDHSLRQMTQFDYTDWTLGATFAVPLGNRRARADIVVNELKLAKTHALLEQYENQITYDFAALLVEIEAAWKRFQSAMRQAHETDAWLRLARIRYSTPPVQGGSQDWLLISLVDYQQAMQSRIDAITDAGELLAEYNTLLARLFEAQGTLLDQHRVELAGEEQPIPDDLVPPGPPIDHDAAPGGLLEGPEQYPSTEPVLEGPTHDIPSEGFPPTIDPQNSGIGDPYGRWSDAHPPAGNSPPTMLPNGGIGNPYGHVYQSGPQAPVLQLPNGGIGDPYGHFGHATPPTSPAAAESNRNR